MSHAERCPICYGKGRIPKDYTTSAEEVTCHGCSGKGWVEVSDYLPAVPTWNPFIWYNYKYVNGQWVMTCQSHTK